MHFCFHFVIIGRASSCLPEAIVMAQVHCYFEIPKHQKDKSLRLQSEYIGILAVHTGCPTYFLPFTKAYILMGI